MKDWKERLEKIMEHATEEKLNTESALKWLSKQVVPAFDELEDELKKYARADGNFTGTQRGGRSGSLSRTLSANYDKGRFFGYTIKVSSIAGNVKVRRISKYNSGTKNYKELAIIAWTKDTIIDDFIEEYENWIRLKL